jgi:hypothetical protein
VLDRCVVHTSGMMDFTKHLSKSFSVIGLDEISLLTKALSFIPVQSNRIIFATYTINYNILVDIEQEPYNHHLDFGSDGLYSSNSTLILTLTAFIMLTTRKSLSLGRTISIKGQIPTISW